MPSRSQILNALLKTVYYFLIVLQILTCLPVLLCAFWWSIMITLALGMSGPNPGDAQALKGAWWEILLVFLQTLTLSTILILNLLNLYDATDNPPNRAPTSTLTQSSTDLRKEALKSGLATLSYILIILVPILPVLRSVSMAKLCWVPVVFLFYPALALSYTFYRRAKRAEKRAQGGEICLSDADSEASASASVDGDGDVEAQTSRHEEEEEEAADYWTVGNEDENEGVDGDGDVDIEAGIPLLPMRKRQPV